MADRYHYLPSIGLAIMLAWGIPLLIKRESVRKKILFPAGITALIIMAVLTWKQCGYWRDSIELWNHALHVTKNNYMAHSCLGKFLYKKGDIKESFYHFNEAIRLKPDYSEAYNDRGSVYDKLEQYQPAIEDFSKAITFRENYADALYNRALVYNKLGQYHLAIEDFSKAVNLEEDNADSFYDRGVLYTNLGQYQQAIEDFNRVIRLNPAYFKAYNNMAGVYLQHGNKELGCYYAQKACAQGGLCRALTWAKGNGLCR
jgi:tetratricopeptide (TPR) repeat protein